jgi:hypothetical protein
MESNFSSKKNNPLIFLDIPLVGVPMSNQHQSRAILIRLKAEKRGTYGIYKKFSLFSMAEASSGKVLAFFWPPNGGAAAAFLLPFSFAVSQLISLLYKTFRHLQISAANSFFSSPFSRS